MYINIENRLKHLQTHLENNKPIEELPVNGTLAVIDGSLDFPKIDGYIQFMKLVMDQIPVIYGKQNPEWQKRLDRIYNMAEKLQDSNTRFTGHTAKEFKEYCERVSYILNKQATPLKIPVFDIATEDNLMPFMKKHVERDNYKGFFYEPEEDYLPEKGYQKVFMDDIMKQLSGCKFEKPTERKHDISYHLLRSGYHEHIHDALNIIINAAVYAINCSSTREQEAYSFDTQKIHNELEYAKIIIERTKTLV